MFPRDYSVVARGENECARVRAILDNRRIAYSTFRDERNTSVLMVASYDRTRAEDAILRATELKVPTDWGCFSSKGNRAITRLATTLANNMDASGLRRFFRAYWRHCVGLVEGTRDDGIGDTAVREAVWAFGLAAAMRIWGRWEGREQAEQIWQEAEQYGWEKWEEARSARVS